MQAQLDLAAAPKARWLSELIAVWGFTQRNYYL